LLQGGGEKIDRIIIVMLISVVFKKVHASSVQSQRRDLGRLEVEASPAQTRINGVLPEASGRLRAGLEGATRKGVDEADFVARLVLTVEAERTERNNLHAHYAGRISTNAELSRALVSFQANKSAPFYRWLKYREGFSTDLVRHLLKKLEFPQKDVLRVLDPFAGAGTTLTTATKAGCKAVGIELLPVGTAAIRARFVADRVSIESFKTAVSRLKSRSEGAKNQTEYVFPHLRITEMAFSRETEEAIGSFLAFTNSIKDRDVKYLLWFACLAILEDISFTRKDGQYLRWDIRSGRELKSKKKFKKPEIPSFEQAIGAKLDTMAEDLSNRNGGAFSRNAKILTGSCLTVLPKLESGTFDLILTSPPYCNRYDYTRTYALELAFMGCDESALKELRQSLLSCTVENRSKRDELREAYAKRGRSDFFARVERAFVQQAALHEVLSFLDARRKAGELNNNNIPNLVENYFFEMNIVIHEFARLLAPGGCVAMVNDNVQYCGEEVPVDLILSDFAASAGLNIENIWVLPQGKGNSSQQMGEHGRNEIRKCVYVWRKTNRAKA
jgi:DNA modification methylase